MTLNFSVKQALETITAELDDCPDLIRQQISLDPNRNAYLIYFDGLSAVNLGTPELIRQLLSADPANPLEKNIFGEVAPTKLRTCNDHASLIAALSSGETILLADGLPYGIAVSSPTAPGKGAFPLVTERSVFGTNLPFQVQLDQNLTLLRRAILSRHLKFKEFKLGGGTGRKVTIAYLKDVTDSNALQTLCQKVQTLATTLESGTENQLESALKDLPSSPFPQYQVTRQLTEAVVALQEGRMVVLREGSSLVWLTPANFFTFFRTPDDLHTHWLLASGLRLFRVAAVFGAVVLPGLYIAFTAFHYQFLSQEFLIFLAQSRTKVPLVPTLEVLLMELILTVFYEMACRLSGPVSIVTGIFGGLSIAGVLLGTGLISNVLLIISALSLLVSFLIPVYHQDTIRLLRGLFIVFASLFGVLGVAISASLTFSHLLVLQTLGQPYLEPLIPLKFQTALSAILQTPRRIFPKKSPTK